MTERRERELLGLSVMGRACRYLEPGESVHLLNRGNNKMPIFRDDADHHVFLSILRKLARGPQFKVHAYTLMQNHYHVVATPSDMIAMARSMVKLSLRYVKYFNRKYDRTGTPWEGRYRAFPIADEGYLRNCVRYVEQNAVRAGLVTRPDDYRWSSYRVHAYGRSSDWLVLHSAFESLGRTSRERQAAYRELCVSPLTEEELVDQRLNICADVEPGRSKMPPTIVSDVAAV